MARPDWIKDAVVAIEAAGKVPTFPGDTPAAEVAIEKLITKLFSECHNGGPLEGDGCPVCRAFKTERAEKRAEVAEKKASESEKKAADLFPVVESLTKQVEVQEKLAQKLAKDANDTLCELVDARELASDAQFAIDELKLDYKSAAEEKDRLRRTVNDLSVEHEALKSRCGAFEKAIRAALGAN
jgi:FtsZ-binding cell division protein ZapB